MTDSARLTPPFQPIAPISLASPETEATGELQRRRLIILAVNFATYFALASAMAGVVGAGGWTFVDAALFACFLIATPWTVLGFWNAIIGLWLLHGRGDGMKQVAPFAAAADADEPVRLKTAVLMTLRNENPARAFARL